MLRSGLSEGEDILATPKAASGRWGSTGAQAEQGLERRHWRSPSIMTEHKLVEVHLQLRAADAVVCADQPLLQVADRAVGQRDDRRDSTAQGRSDRLRLRDMVIAFYRRGANTRQAVGVQRRAGCDMR